MHAFITSLLTAFALVVLSTAVVTAVEPGDEHLLFLRNEHMEVGILVGGAGRVTVLRRVGGANMLRVPIENWVDIPAPDPMARYVDLGGHMLWVGPQKEWWNHQTMVPAKRTKNWPPDPWGNQVPFTVVESTPTSATLTGLVSPITGLAMTKSYRLVGTLVEVVTEARNERDTAVSWGLWSNLQPRPEADAFVLIRPDTVVTQEPEKHPEDAQPLPRSIIDGVLCMPYPHPDSREKPRTYGKFFIHGARPLLAAIDQDTCLVVHTDPVLAEQVAPDQAALEVYRNHGGKTSGLELEHHGVYETLAPGETTRLRERWSVFAYPGADDLAARARFIATVVPLAERDATAHPAP